RLASYSTIFCKGESVIARVYHADSPGNGNPARSPTHDRRADFDLRGQAAMHGTLIRDLGQPSDLFRRQIAAEVKLTFYHIHPRDRNALVVFAIPRIDFERP